MLPAATPTIPSRAVRDFGNEIDHLADQARRAGRAETTWLALRNVYFRDGSANDGWAAMTAAFAARGVVATSADRFDSNGKLVTWVLLRPQL